MVSVDPVAIRNVLQQIYFVARKKRQQQLATSSHTFICPWCTMDGFDEDALWIHSHIYHTNEMEHEPRCSLPSVPLEPGILENINIGQVLNQLSPQIS